MREKVELHVNARLVSYDDDRWSLLGLLRSKAAAVQRSLPGASLVYGSVARGDVGPGSDVDIVLGGPEPSYSVEIPLEARFHVLERRITIASPNSVPKASIILDDGVVVSWPLLPASEREDEFYRFGGAIDATRAGPRERVAGVSKRLLLIQPVGEGHLETSVVGSEVEVARALGLSMAVVMERVRVLTRRDEVGRTGVFRSIPVGEGVTFEQELERLSHTHPAVRRQFRDRQRSR